MLHSTYQNVHRQFVETALWLWFVVFAPCWLLAQHDQKSPPGQLVNDWWLGLAFTHNVLPCIQYISPSASPCALQLLRHLLAVIQYNKICVFVEACGKVHTTVHRLVRAGLLDLGQPHSESSDSSVRLFIFSPQTASDKWKTRISKYFSRLHIKSDVHCQVSD